MRSTLLKRAAIVTIVSTCCLLTAQMSLAARFIDVSGVWSEKYINMLSDQGIIGAEADGKFLPNQPVTRAVFAYWLVKVLGIDGQPVASKPSFPDVKPTDWCYKPVEIIRQNNYISGYADGFRPNQLIQKAEIISIIARTLNAPTPDKAAIDKALSVYTDKSKIPEWAKVGVAQATIANVVIGQSANLLEATKICSRGDTAALLYRLNQYVTHQTITDETTQAQAPPQPPQSQVQVQPQAKASPQGQASGYPQAQAPPQGPPGGYPQAQAPPQGQAGGYPQQAPYGAPGQPTVGQVPGYPQGYPPAVPYQGRVTEQTQPTTPIYTPPPQQNQPPQQQYEPPQQQYQPPQQQYQPPQQQYQQPPQYQPPQYQQPSQTGYAPPNQGYPLQGGYAQTAPYPPPQSPLQGRVAVVGAGTHFQAALTHGLDSETTQVGEPVDATLSSPIMSGGVELVPAGSRVQGSVTNVISAKRFRFGANGKIDIKFTTIETPDGRKFPLNASIDENSMRLTGGSTAGRVGKGLITTGVGAGGGAALGTALGAIVGATSGGGHVGKSTGMGAVFGTALGGGVGLVGAGVRKGSEIKIQAGSPLPIQLDESLQVTTGGAPPPYGQPYPPQYAGYPPQQGYPQQQYQQPYYPPQQ